MFCVEIKLHEGTSVINYYVCPVTNALLTGNKNDLKCFLRFGYGVKEFQMEKFNEKYYNVSGQRCTLGMKRIQNSQPRKRKRKENNNYFRDTSGELDEDANYGAPRKHIVNEVFVFLLKLSTVGSLRHRSKLIQCFHYVWRSRTNPYVRVDEIIDLINQDWINKYCPFKCWQNIEMTSKLYVQEFGEIAVGQVMPRSLQQLCKCTIRKAVMSSNTWHWGIQKLNLPKRMISYLRLEF